MNDYLGRTLSEGDHVVYHTAGRYGTLQKAVVVGFTPKMVKIDTAERWGYKTRVTNVCGSSLIKYDPEDES